MIYDIEILGHEKDDIEKSGDGLTRVKRFVMIVALKSFSAEMITGLPGMKLCRFHNGVARCFLL